MLELKDPSEYKKPSPAPWEVGWKNGTVIFDANDKVVARAALIHRDNKGYCRPQDSTDTSARLANAHLLAAAPELLWAAECAHTFISDLLELGFTQHYEVIAIEEGLRQAINKAHGERQ